MISCRTPIARLSPIGYKLVTEIVRHPVFDAWFTGLRDRQAVARINTRLDRLANGNAGDHKSVGEGVFELRLTYGPGYRVYYAQSGEVLVVLLTGGDKATQAKDIAKAKELAAELE